jgi:hypothetical protein
MMNRIDCSADDAHAAVLGWLLADACIVRWVHDSVLYLSALKPTCSVYNTIGAAGGLFVTGNCTGQHAAQPTLFGAARAGSCVAR